jgi:integrase
MGCIYRRGKTYWVKYYRHGKQFAESVHSDKVEVAKRLLRLREGEISQGKLPGVLFDKISFDEMADDLLTDYKVNKKKSIDRVEQAVEHLEKVFKGMKVVSINTAKINRYIEMRQEEEAANATINRELSALKRMFSLAAKCSPPKVSSIPFISILKEHNIRKGFFEHNEFLALKDKLPDYLKGFATFGYKTGWRHSEIATLTWRHVDLERGTVMLDPGETKNQEGRTLYLDEELKSILLQNWNMRGRGGKALPWVFLNEYGTDRVKRFDKSWSTACKAAKIGPRLFHDLRRTAVRNMLRAGIPERVAMMISGHKTRSVFDRYNIVSENDLRMAAERQEAYLNAL